MKISIVFLTATYGEKFWKHADTLAEAFKIAQEQLAKFDSDHYARIIDGETVWQLEKLS